MIAIEDRNCLAAYKNRYRSIKRASCSSTSNATEEKILQAQVFAELVSHIEGNIANGTHLIKVSELHELYESFTRSGNFKEYK